MLANLYQQNDMSAEAEKMYRRALDGKEKAWGLDHSSTLRTTNNLRLLNASRDGYVKLGEIHSRALDRSNKAHDTDQHSYPPLLIRKAILNASLRRQKKPLQNGK